MEDQRMKRMKISWKASVFMSFKRKRVSQANMSSAGIYSDTTERERERRFVKKTISNIFF